MAKKRMTAAQLANLPQYKDLPPEELEKVTERVLSGEGNIDAIIRSFEKDYDLSHMTANDMLALKELARIFAALSIVENKIKNVLSDGEDDVAKFERLNKIASQLRTDASAIQKDLNITRKARQDAGGQSVVEFIEELKRRAGQFLKDRLCEIYCPKCKMLICKVWFLYPNQANELHFICGREKCGHRFTVASESLISTKKNVSVGPPI